MKKISMLVLVAAALCACHEKSNAAPDDFATIVDEMKKNDDAGVGNPVIVTGERGDFVIKLQETEQLKAIANKQKNAKFLSVDAPKQYISDGFCLVNIIPYNTMVALGTPDNNCSYRLFCGSENDMNYDEFYAVELCGD
jgi:hypothetical protein